MYIFRRAKLCFKRAFELDKRNSETGAKYIDLLLLSASDKSYASFIVQY